MEKTSVSDDGTFSNSDAEASAFPRRHDRRRRRLDLLATVFIGSTIGDLRPVAAYDLPAVNLGLTSFYDGTVPYGPGIYYQHFVQVYSADKFTDGNGQRLKLPSQNVFALTNVDFFAYVFPNKIGPGQLAVIALVPWIAALSVNDGIGNRALSGQGGLGDPVVSLAYQFDPIMGPLGPKFFARLELPVLIPAGEYNRSIAINPGSNFASLNPFIAATYFVTPDLSISTRLHYLYNFANNAPNISFGPDVGKVQAGQAFHGNFTLEYAVTKEFILGMNSYYLEQFTDTKIDGVAAPGRRERVVGIGPGFGWNFAKESVFVFNAYYETMAKNRSEGQRYTFRYFTHF